jgi:hypothetical protein
MTEEELSQLLTELEVASLDYQLGATTGAERARLRVAREEVFAAFEELRQERDDLQSGLESLTPGGSEFYGSPETCLNFVRARMSTVVKFKLERDAALDALKNAHDAIKSLPIDAFGNGSYTEANGEEEFYPIRDELCDNIAKVIASASGR